MAIKKHLSYDGLQEYDNLIKAYADTADASKMDKENPTGTGSFSLNRKADTDIGMNSFAEGSEVTASGAASHAEGYITTATRTCSHAEGYMATSGGDASHAEGWDTKAIASFSHAEGRKTLASGNGSHAEGYGTTASGTYSHAEGKYTMSIGSSSHAEGIGDSIEVSITGDANATNYTLVQALEEDTYIGAGYIVVLNDIYATITEYDETTLTITVDTTLNTDEALNATTVKIYNHIASGSCAHIEGYCNIASNDSAHAEGEFSIASGYASHAEGQGTASGKYSHAEGLATTASGDYSHAEGVLTTASGGWSHAECDGTTASGYASHAEGEVTTAAGDFSHAEGYYTTASSLSQHVQGEYNVLDTESPDARGTYAHIVGNGSSDNKRSNAHTLDWSGNAWFAGDVYVGSTSGTNKDEGSVKLATEEYGDTQIASIPTPDVSGQIDAHNENEAAHADIRNLIPTTLEDFGVTATADELNYVDGVTSNIQNQLDGKAASSHGNHVPTTQTANNAVFLRNDNTWQTVTPANIGAAASSHNQAASTITDGTLAGQVVANATAVATVGTAQVRNIYAGTDDMTAGSTALATGTLYFVYE